MTVHEKDNLFLGRDSQPMNLQVVRAEGSVIFDAQGRRYVDFAMGWCVGNLGWSERDIQTAIKQFNSPAYVHLAIYFSLSPRLWEPGQGKRWLSTVQHKTSAIRHSGE